MAKENEALYWEAMSKKDHAKIIESVSKIPEVNRVITLRTMHLVPMMCLVAMEVSIVDNINTDQIEQVIDTIEERIKSVIDVKTSSKIYVEVERDTVQLIPKRCKTIKRMNKGNKSTHLIYYNALLVIANELIIRFQ